ncbi:MAG TPA: hypothetical protein VN437_00895 [Rectinemataceae bacterium]|nr:hypothetical protein [Rectinemataceae bacterium]
MLEWGQDLAYDSLRSARSTILAAVGSNEATTRMRAIDTILFEVLRWERQVVEAEKYSRDIGYSDYVFRQNTSLCLVLEAKRDGTTFILPNQRIPDRPMGFGILAALCPDAASAMRQASGYAAAEGARFVAISNGHQWILSLAYVVNQSIEERSVIVFPTFDQIERRFDQFWECFSPSGVYSNSVSSLLLESRKAPAPPKLSRGITTYPAPINRNKLSDDIDSVTRLVWDNLNADDTNVEFLRHCYIRPESEIDSLQEARELLYQRKETDTGIIQSANIPDDLPALIDSYRPEKPIIVLGRIGHGKSTFLKYLRQIEAAKIMESYVQVDIDFVDRPARADEVEAFLLGRVDEQLLSRYGIDITENSVVRGSLHSELTRFRKSPVGQAYISDPTRFQEEELAFIAGITANRHEYFARVLYHLRYGRRKSVAVFLDNLDRRDDRIQEEAFLRASAIARDWACPVFVCLRPGTFWRSKKEGVLDSVAPRLISISSPKVAPLLKRRLEFAARMARGEVPFVGRSGAASATISVHLPKVATLLDCAAQSFSRNAELRDLVSAFSNGNVRELLRLVQQVLTSQHLDTSKIIEKFQTVGYRIAAHEALRALLFGDYAHFDPDSSVVVNLFDILRADPMQHFSRVLALRFLDGIPETHPTFGYTSVQALSQQMMQIGYTVDHFNATMEVLFRKGCCESEVAGQEWSESSSRLRISPLGRYHVNTLLEAFNYYDAVAIDTPIIVEQARRKIADVFSIRERLERADAFIEYLLGASDSVQDADGKRFIERKCDAAKREIDAIRADLPNATRP